MRAVVLVGGFGTRLRPLTLHRPKQMLPVVDRPMIEWVAGWLAANGVTEMVLSLGYRPEAFLSAYPDGRCAGVAMSYAVEPEPLDTAGAIRFAARSAGLDAGDAPFLVVNGDVVTTFDLAPLVALHQEAGAEATITLTPVEDPSRYGVVAIDGRGRVEAFIEKPPREAAPSNWINAGTYLLEPSVVGRIPEGRRVSIERETFPAMVADGALYAVQSDAYWIDAGTPTTYLQVQLDLIGRDLGGGASFVAPDATVHPGARLRRSIVMRGARVADGAEVDGSVIGEGATVGAGSLVADSVIGPRATVGERCSLRAGTLVGDDVEVPDGTEIANGLMPEPED
jgi:mannose-1-phosphate guanylyltransferase